MTNQEFGPLGWRPPYDDGYITLTSAQALWTGSIPAYPGVPVLAGITSPAHCLLVALLLRVAPPMTALWLSQVIGVVLYGSGLCALARAWRLDWWTAAGVVAIGLSVGWIPHHLFNGLETGLLLGAVSWALALASSDAPWAPAAYVTVPFVRPEFGVLALALLAWSLWRAPRERRTRLIAIALLAAVPWIAWLLWQNGGMVPSTAGVKRAFVGDTCRPLLERTVYVFGGVLVWWWSLGLIAIAAVVGCMRRGLPRVCAGAFLVAMIAYMFILPSHIPTYHHQRYLFGWTPVAMLGAVAFLGRWPIARRAIPLIILSIALRAPSVAAERREWADTYRAEQTDLIAWLHANVGRAERLMVIDAGYLAYATDYLLVDAVGLKGPVSAELHQAITGPSCGERRGEALTRIAAESGARVFVSVSEWEKWLGLSRQMREAGWHVEAIRTRALTHPHDAFYPVFRISPGIIVIDGGAPRTRTEDRLPPAHP